MNIRTTLSAPAADIERCAGRCKIAAETIFHKSGDVLEEMFLRGAHAACYALLDMEYGNTDDDFLNKVTMRYGSRHLDDEGVGDE